jgi:hypothetical protein
MLWNAPVWTQPSSRSCISRRQHKRPDPATGRVIWRRRVGDRSSRSTNSVIRNDSRPATASNSCAAQYQPHRRTNRDQQELDVDTVAICDKELTATTVRHIGSGYPFGRGHRLESELIRIGSGVISWLPAARRPMTERYRAPCGNPLRDNRSRRRDRPPPRCRR